MGRLVFETFTGIPVVRVADGDAFKNCGMFRENLQQIKKGFVAVSSEMDYEEIRLAVTFWTEKAESVLLAEERSFDVELFGESLTDDIGWLERENLAMETEFWANTKIRWNPDGHGFLRILPMFFEIIPAPQVKKLAICRSDGQEITDSMWKGETIATEIYNSLDRILTETEPVFSFTGSKNWTHTHSHWEHPRSSGLWEVKM